MFTKKNNYKYIPIIIICVLILVILPNYTSLYMTHVMSMALINYMCVLSVYVLLGLCGQNSFAQAGLWGVGAYISGNLLIHSSIGSIP